MSISTVTRTEEAYSKLRRAITTNELPQGVWLRQRTIAAQLGMSPTPLVQAFHRLEKEGFLECVPQWGVRVRVLSVHELKQVFCMRVAMESIVFRELASRVDEVASAVQAMKPLCEEVDRADEALRIEILAGRKQVGEVLLGDQEIHWGLARLSKLELVAGEIDRLCLLPATVLALVPKTIPTSITHCELIDRILAGNPNQAEKAIRSHIEQHSEYVIARLREEYGNGPIIHDRAEAE